MVGKVLQGGAQRSPGGVAHKIVLGAAHNIPQESLKRQPAACHYYVYQRKRLVLLSVADPDQGSGDFFTPRSRIRDPGWVNNQDPDPG